MKNQFVTIEDDPTGVVQKLVFAREPEAGRQGARQHEDLATELSQRATSLFSMIITCEHLRDELYNDPRFIIQTNEIIVSEIEEEARKRMTNRYRSVGDTHEILRAHGVPLRAGNVRPVHGEESEADRKFLTKLEDLVFRAEECSQFWEILNEEYEGTKYVYDEDTDEERELTDEEHERAWEKRTLELFLPRVQTNFERIYNMPLPLCYWDSRNPWQQWYFWMENEIPYYEQGGSGSSGAREIMGLFAHTYAYLEHTNARQCPTIVLKYDSENRLLLLGNYESLRVINRELSGNYQVDLRKTKPFFHGRLLQVTEKATVEEAEDGY